MTQHEARIHNKQVREASKEEHFIMTNNELEPQSSGVYFALVLVVVAIGGLFYLFTH